MVVQTAGDPAAVTRAVVERVYALDRDQPVTDVRTVESFLNDFIYAGPRFNVVLLSVFAALGLTLAVVGVYGVMAHTVAQQTREIGVRIALGADPGSVGRMVVRSGAILLLMGVALGLVGSVFAARLLAQQIWNVSPFDPISFARGVSRALRRRVCRHARGRRGARAHAADRGVAPGIEVRSPYFRPLSRTTSSEPRPRESTRRL